MTINARLIVDMISTILPFNDHCMSVNRYKTFDRIVQLSPDDYPMSLRTSISVPSGQSTIPSAATAPMMPLLPVIA